MFFSSTVATVPTVPLFLPFLLFLMHVNNVEHVFLPLFLCYYYPYSSVLTSEYLKDCWYIWTPPPTRIWTIAQLVKHWFKQFRCISWLSIAPVLQTDHGLALWVRLPFKDDIFSLYFHNCLSECITGMISHVYILFLLFVLTFHCSSLLDLMMSVRLSYGVIIIASE